MTQILISGSLAYDHIMTHPGIFREALLGDTALSINVSFFIESLQESFGGTAGNIAYNLALLGGSPSIIARAGNDFDVYKNWLEKNNVDTSLIQICNDKRTAIGYIVTDTKDNQIAAFYPGAMKEAYDIEKIQTEVNRSNMAIIAPGNIDDIKTLPEVFRSAGMRFFFDPSQQLPVLTPDDIKNAIEGSAALFSNEYELSIIQKKTQWDNKEILEHTGMIITTMGEDGSKIRTKDQTIDIPAAKPEAVLDPTGAGDAYRAAFLFALTHEWSLETAGKLAAVAACYPIEKRGTQAHTFTFDAIASRYEKNFSESLPSLSSS